ncbi:hypothetical protein YPPY55_3810, partial [Yersinia pestis PY-55]
MTKCP